MLLLLVSGRVLKKRKESTHHLVTLISHVAEAFLFKGWPPIAYAGQWSLLKVSIMKGWSQWFGVLETRDMWKPWFLEKSVEKSAKHLVRSKVRWCCLFVWPFGDSDSLAWISFCWQFLWHEFCSEKIRVDVTPKRCERPPSIQGKLSVLYYEFMPEWSSWISPPPRMQSWQIKV